jgi:SAM-dependent methyltransferase
VLEVGCGTGELALALAAAGYGVVAIDPEAPAGPLFRRLRLEDFAEPGRYRGVIASLSLHHIHPLEGALDHIGRLLEPDGLLLVREFAVERFLEEPTARWYHGELLARELADAAVSFQTWLADRRGVLADLHSSQQLRDALAARFSELHFRWTPYLYSWELDEEAGPRESKLIAAGEIQATGFLYAGNPSTSWGHQRGGTPWFPHGPPP